MQTTVSEGVAATRKQYYDTLAPQSLAPLWEVLKGLVPTEPKSKFAPHVWQPFAPGGTRARCAAAR